MKSIADLVYDRVAEAIPSGSTVLELGCNVGRLADRLSSKEVTYHGVDRSSLVVDALKERWAERPSFSFERGDLSSWMPRTGGWGFIVLLNVLYAPEVDVTRLLAMSAERTAPTGAVIVSGPTAAERLLQAEPLDLELLRETGLINGSEDLFRSLQEANVRLRCERRASWSAEGMVALLELFGFSKVELLDTALDDGATFVVAARKA